MMDGIWIRDLRDHNGHNRPICSAGADDDGEAADSTLTQRDPSISDRLEMPDREDPHEGRDEQHETLGD